MIKGRNQKYNKTKQIHNWQLFVGWMIDNLDWNGVIGGE